VPLILKQNAIGVQRWHEYILFLFDHTRVIFGGTVHLNLHALLQGED